MKIFFLGYPLGKCLDIPYINIQNCFVAVLNIYFHALKLWFKLSFPYILKDLRRIYRIRDLKDIIFCTIFLNKTVFIIATLVDIRIVPGNIKIRLRLISFCWSYGSIVCICVVLNDFCDWICFSRSNIAFLVKKTIIAIYMLFWQALHSKSIYLGGKLRLFNMRKNNSKDLK